jgi:hypothetical protein
MVASSGSIGLDETLDLHLEVPRLLLKDKRGPGPLRCHITGTVRDPKIAAEGATLAVHLTDAKHAALKVENVDLKFSVEGPEGARMLTLAPATILAKHKLTPDLDDELLHLIVPTIGDLGGVQGEISLALDTFRVPLGVPIREAAKKVELVGHRSRHPG